MPSPGPFPLLILTCLLYSLLTLPPSLDITRLRWSFPPHAPSLLLFTSHIRTFSPQGKCVSYCLYQKVVSTETPGIYENISWQLLKSGLCFGSAFPTLNFFLSPLALGRYMFHYKYCELLTLLWFALKFKARTRFETEATQYTGMVTGRLRYENRRGCCVRVSREVRDPKCVGSRSAKSIETGGSWSLLGQ